MANIKKFLTQSELVEALESVLDEIEESRSQQVDGVYLPPDVDTLTDEEDFDDDTLLPNAKLAPEGAGVYEMHVDRDFDESDDEPLAAKIRKRTTITRDPVWKNDNITITVEPNSTETDDVENLVRKIGGKTPLEVFFLFLDEELLSLIVEHSNKYAMDSNRHDSQLTSEDLKKFIGILLLTGYHYLPQMQLYWSMDEDKGVNIVKKCMSRNKFRRIKQNLHLSDNEALDKSDKYSKLRPFFDALNKRFMQFGVFSHNLAIDEQMVPYFGRHSCKMYIKGKPVRFGFKLWCLCSSDGYLYQFIPYGGATVNKSEFGLGGKVVLDLLEIVEFPENPRIFFDNFFTSYKLMRELSQRKYFVTGTIRENRIAKCTVKPVKLLSKEIRGSYDCVQDETTGIIITRWNDNSVVTIASNIEGVEPLHQAKRYDRKQKKETTIPQPKVVAEYNKFMGGVDLHDNAVVNYRIKCKGKKWWWPLFTNAINSIMVNSWKLYRLANDKKMSQLDFKSYIVVRLLAVEEQGIPSRSVPSEVRKDNVGHIISVHETKKRLRCKVCKSNTIYLCKKCNVHLHSECFSIYHA